MMNDPTDPNSAAGMAFFDACKTSYLAGGRVDACEDLRPCKNGGVCTPTMADFSCKVSQYYM